MGSLRVVLCFFLFLIAVQVLPVAATSRGAHIVLSNDTWKIQIDAETLQTRGGVEGGDNDFLLSGPQSQPLRVSGLQVSARRARWDYPDQRLTVSIRLEPDGLAVEFKAQTAGEFSWPILPAQPNLRSYLLPLGEGALVPVHDMAWSAYLTKLEGLSTTAELSLPLWGEQDSVHTYSYLLTNPFNNELTFHVESGSLAAALTHHFTRISTDKTYGVRICLGSLSPLEPARQYRKWLIHTGQFVTLKEKIAHTPEAAKLLGAAQIYLWGDGLSPKMLDSLKANRFDRLWLGSPAWNELRDNAPAIQKAKRFGYLIAPYDSYDSVHSPDAKPDDTWETAQLDRKLYDTGAIELADGKKKTGFRRQGYYVSEQIAEPYVRERVSRLMKAFACNSWFIDCDAAGEFYEDFSAAHPATQEDEMRARLRRMSWIRDTFGLVIGSEGGSAYSAGTIHFAHGIITPIFGWGDPELKSKNSPYFLGAYYPEGGPAMFFKQVRLAPKYYHVVFDPRFRAPLYEAAFHDSVVVANHWSLPTLKFSDQVVERTLIEQLYGVPPLYHLNSEEFAKRKAWMKAQYAFFSPLHRVTGLLPMSDFAWLTEDREVQRTVFGDKLEVIANFRSEPYSYAKHRLPARSVMSLDRSSGTVKIFTPSPK